jgi:hypothetical protein
LTNNAGQSDCGADRRQCPQTHCELPQSTPLNDRLLKARQRCYLCPIAIEIDLHTTPAIAHITVRYDITKVVKYSS